jgi:hypothetical protein
MNDNAATTEPRGGGRSAWLAGGIVAIVLVVVAVAAILILDTREDTEYLPGSPEAAFQAYALAWDVGDTDVAWAALTTEAQDRVSRYDFREANSWREEEAQRIWIDSRSGSDDRVVLHLTIETIYDDGLFGSGRGYHRW